MANNAEELVNVDKVAFKRDLESIIDAQRLRDYQESVSRHVERMRSEKLSTFLLIEAFQSLFLETYGLLGTLWTPACAELQLPFYKRDFVPRTVHTFQQLCATALAASHGYPLPAYTILRNTFDQLVLISAVMQGITDFFRNDPRFSYQRESA